MAEQISLEALAQRKSMQAAPAAQPGSAAQIETKIEAQIEMLTPEQKKRVSEIRDSIDLMDSQAAVSMEQAPREISPGSLTIF